MTDPATATAGGSDASTTAFGHIGDYFLQSSPPGFALLSRLAFSTPQTGEFMAGWVVGGMRDEIRVSRNRLLQPTYHAVVENAVAVNYARPCIWAPLRARPVSLSAGATRHLVCIDRSPLMQLIDKSIPSHALRNIFRVGILLTRQRSSKTLPCEACFDKDAGVAESSSASTNVNHNTAEYIRQLHEQIVARSADDDHEDEDDDIERDKPKRLPAYHCAIIAIYVHEQTFREWWHTWKVLPYQHHICDMLISMRNCLSAHPLHPISSCWERLPIIATGGASLCDKIVTCVLDDARTASVDGATASRRMPVFCNRDYELPVPGVDGILLNMFTKTCGVRRMALSMHAWNGTGSLCIVGLPRSGKFMSMLHATRTLTALRTETVATVYGHGHAHAHTVHKDEATYVHQGWTPAPVWSHRHMSEGDTDAQSSYVERDVPLPHSPHFVPPVCRHDHLNSIVSQATLVITSKYSVWRRVAQIRIMFKDAHIVVVESMSDLKRITWMDVVGADFVVIVFDVLRSQEYCSALNRMLDVMKTTPFPSAVAEAMAPEHQSKAGQPAGGDTSRDLGASTHAYHDVDTLSSVCASDGDSEIDGRSGDERSSEGWARKRRRVSVFLKSEDCSEQADSFAGVGVGAGAGCWPSVADVCGAGYTSHACKPFSNTHGRIQGLLDTLYICRGVVMNAWRAMGEVIGAAKMPFVELLHFKSVLLPDFDKRDGSAAYFESRGILTSRMDQKKRCISEWGLVRLSAGMMWASGESAEGIQFITPRPILPPNLLGCDAEDYMAAIMAASLRCVSTIVLEGDAGTSPELGTGGNTLALARSALETIREDVIPLSMDEELGSICRIGSVNTGTQIHMFDPMDFITSGRLCWNSTKKRSTMLHSMMRHVWIRPSDINTHILGPIENCIAVLCKTLDTDIRIRMRPPAVNIGAVDDNPAPASPVAHLDSLSPSSSASSSSGASTAESTASAFSNPPNTPASPPQSSNPSMGRIFTIGLHLTDQQLATLWSILKVEAGVDIFAHMTTRSMRSGALGALTATTLSEAEIRRYLDHVRAHYGRITTFLASHEGDATVKTCAICTVSPCEILWPCAHRTCYACMVGIAATHMTRRQAAWQEDGRYPYGDTFIDDSVSCPFCRRPSFVRYPILRDVATLEEVAKSTEDGCIRPAPFTRTSPGGVGVLSMAGACAGAGCASVVNQATLLPTAPPTHAPPGRIVAHDAERHLSMTAEGIQAPKITYSSASGFQVVDCAHAAPRHCGQQSRDPQQTEDIADWCCAHYGTWNASRCGEISSMSWWLLARLSMLQANGRFGVVVVDTATQAAKIASMLHRRHITCDTEKCARDSLLQSRHCVLSVAAVVGGLIPSATTVTDVLLLGFENKQRAGLNVDVYGMLRQQRTWVFVADSPLLKAGLEVAMKPMPRSVLCGDD